MFSQLIVSIKSIVAFTLLLGGIYTAVITLVAQTIFHHKANGSIITRNDKPIGSALLSQDFDSTYFSARPSAIGYNPMPSSGSNLAPTSAALKEIVKTRETQFRSQNSIDSLKTIPSEMIFASASGVDPHISPESAFLQMGRIARIRGLSEVQVNELRGTIVKITENRFLHVLGEARVNVLLLNMELDNISKKSL